MDATASKPEPTFLPVDLELIDEAIDGIQRDGWTQGAMQRSTGERCLVGHISYSGTTLGGRHGETGLIDRRIIVQRLLREITGWASLFTWNDEGGRSEEEVIDLLYRARERVTRELSESNDA